MTGDARRQEIYEIPLQAIREAVVNAVAHRDYFADGSHITVEIFSDRLEIGNPGGLPKGLTRDSFGKKAVRRNPIITSLLQRCNFVETMGTGINSSLPLPVFKTEGMFSVVFYKKFNFEEWVEKWVNTLSENKIRILQNIYKNPSISKHELKIKIGLSKTAIDNNIESLKKDGFIKREGNNRSGLWIIEYILPEGG